MARYVGHAVDQYGRDIPGAYVTVVGMDGSAATLTDDYGNPISQPLKTDDFGGYYFNTTDGLYTITTTRSGDVIAKEYNVVIGILPTTNGFDIALAAEASERVAGDALVASNAATALATEVTRATMAEQAEVTRATGVEAGLDARLTTTEGEIDDLQTVSNLGGSIPYDTYADAVADFAAYNPATAYAVGMRATDQGALWLNILAGTGVAPPTLPTTSNANWQLAKNPTAGQAIVIPITDTGSHTDPTNGATVTNTGIHVWATGTSGTGFHYLYPTDAALAKPYADAAAASAAQADADVATLSPLLGISKPYALDFAGGRPLLDLTNAFGGGAATYLPTSIYLNRNGTIVSQTVANSASTEFPDSVKLVVNTSQRWFLWYDIDDNSYHSASGLAANMPTKGLDKIIPLLSLFGKSLDTFGITYANSEDLGALVWTGPIVIESTNVRLSAYYRRGEQQAGYTLVTPPVASGYASAGRFFKIGRTLSQIANIWHDERTRLAGAASGAGSISGTTFTASAAPTSGKWQVGQYLTGTGVLPGTYITVLGTGTGGAGTYTVGTNHTTPTGAITVTGQLYNFIKLAQGSNPPISPAWAGTLLVRALGDDVQVPNGGIVVGEVPGGSVNNQFSYSKDISLCPSLIPFGTTQIVPVVDTNLNSLGITTGLHDATNGVSYGDVSLPQKLNNMRLFMRIWVKADLANTFGNNISGSIWSADESQHVSFAPFAMEEQVSTTVACFSASVSLNTAFNVGRLRFGSNDPSVSVTPCGIQFAIAPSAQWIRWNDQPFVAQNEERLDALEGIVSDPALDLMVPTHLHMIAGRKRQMYIDQMTSLRGNGTSFDAYLSALGPTNLPYVPHARTCFDIDPALLVSGSGAASATFGLRRFSNDNLRIEKPVTVHVAPSSGSGAIALAGLGDSILNRNILKFTNDKLTASGYAATSIGTINNNGAQGEGREGKTFAQFVYTDTSLTPVAVGGEAAYLALSDTDKMQKNPFVRASTGGDNPAYVQNGYIFDYAFYLSRFSLATPTHVLIELGTNDVTTPGTAAARILLGMTIMYNQIRAALPGAYIGFMTVGLAKSALADARQPTQVSAWFRQVANFVAAQGDAKLRMIPAHLFLSPDANWPTYGATTDPDFAYTTATMGQSSGDVPLHPNTIGQHQLAEEMAAWCSTTKSNV